MKRYFREEEQALGLRWSAIDFEQSTIVLFIVFAVDHIEYSLI